MNIGFDAFDFDNDIVKGIEDARFEFCMPVQAKCFEEVIKNGKDVTVQSQTGTGKTAAFLLSIFQLFKSNAVQKQKALIIVPTRELAVQVEDEARLLGKYLNLTVASFYGGVGYHKQEKAVEQGVDIAIGTPGRLIDFGQKGKLPFKEFGVVVIDEADRLFDMGFLPDLRKMIRMLAPVNERRTLMFSATLSVKVQNLAWEYMHNPINIEIEPEHITVEEITQSLYHVSKNEKFKLLLGILSKEDPKTAIVFANTKHMVVELAKRLEINGIRCEYIMGDLPQKKRLRIIDQLKKNELHFLVATDVAARGLHVDDLSMVINYDIPEDPENYVHRIGRTARAGRSGKAITFACESYVFGLESVEDLIGMKIPVEWADDSFYSEDKSEGMTFRRYDDRSSKRGDRNRSDRSGGRQRRSSGSRSGARSGEKYSDSRSRYKDDKERGSERRDRKPKSESRSGSRDSSAANTGGRDKYRDNRNKNRQVTGRNVSQGSKSSNRKHSDTRKGAPAGKPAQYEKGQKRKSVKKGSKQSIESRVAYYKEKYGEDFTVSEEAKKKDKNARKTGGVFGKLLGKFKKKKG